MELGRNVFIKIQWLAGNKPAARKRTGNMKERRQLTSRLLTMKEAVRYLNISQDTLYKMVSQRKIPFVKINRSNRFDLASLEKWIKENTKMPMY